jgi:CTP synthase
MDLPDAYKSLNEALSHAGLQTLTDVQVDYVEAEDIERDGTGLPGWCRRDPRARRLRRPRRRGQDRRGALRARERIPFLGICLGMHVALIEYARNVCGLEHAHSARRWWRTRRTRSSR